MKVIPKKLYFCPSDHLRIDRNFCSVHEEITSIRLYTSCNPRSMYLLLIRRGFAPGFVNYIKGALDPQPQVIKFTSCFPMIGRSLQVLRLLPPLKLVAMI